MMRGYLNITHLSHSFYGRPSNRKQIVYENLDNIWLEAILMSPPPGPNIMAGQSKAIVYENLDNISREAIQMSPPPGPIIMAGQSKAIVYENLDNLW
jgi:hypothetical protein